MPSKAFEHYRHLTSEVATLISRPGSDHITYKAGIVLLAAAWERYVELLVREGAAFMVAEATSSDHIPAIVKLTISNSNLTGDGRQKHQQFAWMFTEDKWKGQVLQHVGSISNDLNTPNSKNVRDLYRKALGIEDVTTCWKRPPSRSAEHARYLLDEWLVLRHEVAHGSHASPFIKRDVERFKSTLDATVSRQDAYVSKHLKAIVGKLPWS